MGRSVVEQRDGFVHKHISEYHSWKWKRAMVLTDPSVQELDTTSVPMSMDLLGRLISLMMLRSGDGHDFFDTFQGWSGPYNILNCILCAPVAAVNPEATATVSKGTHHVYK